MAPDINGYHQVSSYLVLLSRSGRESAAHDFYVGVMTTGLAFI
jgi:hypothetical protein